MAVRETPAVRVTGHLQHAAWQEHTLPPVEQIRDGIWSIPVPFDGPIRYTLSYLVVGDEGTLLVDPGYDSPAGRLALTDGLAAAGLTVDQVGRIVVTHFHLDHLDLARWVAERSGATVGLHAGDLDVIEHQRDRAGFLARDRQWLTAAGTPPELVESLIFPAEVLSAPPPASILTALQDVEDLTGIGVTVRVLFTPGHSPGHVCLYLPEHDLLLSGDHILPRISASVGFGGRRPADPLADHRRSLALCAALGDVEVGPAHEYRFADLPRRVEQLLRQHDERADEVETAYRGGRRTVWQVAEAISWSRGWEAQDSLNRRLAVSETECHLTALAHQGRIDWEPLGG